MQPRQPRLGDVVDDYCSRCRLLSNHAIAAIVDDAIKQTRCSTCDFEHPYKDGKLPTRRSKKDGTTSSLYRQVLDNVTDGMPDDTSAARPPAAKVVLARPDAPAPVTSDPQTPAAVPTPAPTPVPAPARPAAAPAAAAAPRLAPAPQPAAPLAAGPASSGPASSGPGSAAPGAETPAEDRDPGPEGIVHRRLIRATLPKVEGAEREPRPIPTFTVHEAATARNKFRRFPRPGGQGQGNAAGGGNGQGNFNGNGMPRFGHGGQPSSPFGARGHGKGGGPHPNRGGGGQQGNRANQQQRRGPKGR
jgi:hypothetical protein